LNLADQEGQVRRHETETGRWHAVMLDIRRDVFVVRIGARQRRIGGMGLRIIPVELITPAPDFLAITLGEQWASIPGQTFIDNQPMASR